MKRLLPLLLIVNIVLAGCLSARPLGDSQGTLSEPAALGSVTVASRVLGSETLRPSDCTSGDRQFFLGADFRSKGSDLVLRLVIDPLDGPAVRLFSDGAQFDPSILFRRSDCSIFHFSFESTGWRVNDAYDYRLTLDLDCSRSGESLKGSVSTSHCH